MSSSDSDDAPTRLSCGVQVAFTHDLPDTLHQLVFQGTYSFIVTPLVHPRLRRDASGVSARRTSPLTRSDLILESRTWGNCVVGQVSEWIDCDAPDLIARQSAEKALQEELSWACHISMSALLLPMPGRECYNYANVLKRIVCGNNQNPGLWIKFPLRAAPKQPSQIDGAMGPQRDPWFTWNTLRTLCGHSSSLGVALELGISLPEKLDVNRWVGEPVRALLIPTNVFLTNSKGYPVLSAAHQQLIVKFYEHGVQFVLTGRPRHVDGHEPYYLYLQHLIQRIPGQSVKDRFESPFYDYLQSPLQPLGDHLESQMYETFEKDPVKYEMYEKAIALALSETPVKKISVVMVVGAGRGPLVRCALRAADSVQRRIRMYAVEKNPNAVVTLRNMHHMLGWGATVQIVHTDMRYWNSPELADILVSELLGSWGDNELSPECLDGAEKFLNPNGGISIPYEYTSFVEPISTPKLWNDCSAFGDDKHMETMYVVKLHNFSTFARPKPVFTFAHPSWNKGLDEQGNECFSPHRTTDPALLGGNIDNTRYAKVEFAADHTGLLHGFGAYFEARLYKDVMISINPPTHSPGMFSWFPIYIPLRSPQVVNKGDTIRALFWRHCKSTKVWYEWALAEPEPSMVHNTNGQSSPINLATD